ncbi:hypothetical protein LEP1GSC038_4063 [Leptospira weilii str. 2006001855]|uniref:Uncharacterized protein n=1 Tax=Leptospira weilii str. 2006001855 TaxID=996804 RepID=M6FNU0_9LEPT|nr:hypothetical protein LEP1GSC038_4063 [Leptospira weilii str. 2006001855]
MKKIRFSNISFNTSGGKDRICSLIENSSPDYQAEDYTDFFKILGKLFKYDIRSR